MPVTPTQVRFHTRPAQLDVGAVVRVTNLSPAQVKQLETFIKEQLGGQAYN